MIKARNIIKSYQNGESRFQVLKDISLDIEDNDFMVILGASGSGKSTFLNVISGLERPDSGKVFYDGKDITALSDNELTSLDLSKNTKLTVIDLSKNPGVPFVVSSEVYDNVAAEGNKNTVIDSIKK